GFNEAEARAPRMARSPDCCAGRDASASMRPRRVRLGWPEAVLVPRRPHRGFNEAEARAPRMGGRDRYPDLIADQASMRPRRVRLGWADAGRHRAYRGAASMRPRRVRLGWSSARLSLWPRLSLQ